MSSAGAPRTCVVCEFDAKFRNVPRARAERVAACGAAAAVFAGLLLARPHLIAEPLVRRDAPRDVDAVFVFSGDVDFHRTIFAARVFRARNATWFIVSGAGAGGDNGELMAEAARREGIPGDAILVEKKATTTRENVALSAPILASHEIRSVAVVTSPFHSRRAALAAQHAWRGVEVVSLPVEGSALDCDVSAWESERGCSSMLQTEWEKLLGYFLRGWL